MSKKQPALITRYKLAVVDVENLTKELAEVQKKLKSSDDLKDIYARKSSGLETEIEQLHCVFDSLPGAAARKTEAEDSWQRKDISIMARLASFLAQRH